MLHTSLLILILLACGAGLLLVSRSGRLAVLSLGLALLGLAGYWLSPAPPAPEQVYPPPIVGVEAALRLGLWAQTQLPPRRPHHAAIAWLDHTDAGRRVLARPVQAFRPTAATAYRREGIRKNFRHRFGWKDALTSPFEPIALIVHSTESETEASAFAVFDRSGPGQYLGGVWTHFSVDPDGKIYQYGPIDRISKGQSGLDDAAIGVEIVGTASLWAVEGHQPGTGSIISRWRNGQQTQLKAVADLLATLSRHYAIPVAHIYSHEDLGHVRDRKGTFPDYAWLRHRIRDRVYLGLEPTLGPDFTPEEHYAFLAPYDRQDPGRDVMAELHGLLAEARPPLPHPRQN